MRFGISAPGGSDDDDSKKSQGREEAAYRPFEGENLKTLEEKLGYTFVNKEWLQRAITHRSVQSRGLKNDYERLEFLGDAVLDLAVAQLLLDSYPDAREGELSKMRAALVNTASLADVARGLELGPYVRLSRGELASGGAERPSILADVLEALMGAIYKEAGYEASFQCVSRLFGERLRSVTPMDPKTELQEALHAAGSEAPQYFLECVEGPEHAPTFVSVVKVDGQIVGRGSGATKKASQQGAAAQALSRIRGGDAIDQRFTDQSCTEQSCTEQKDTKVGDPKDPSQ